MILLLWLSAPLADKKTKSEGNQEAMCDRQYWNVPVLASPWSSTFSAPATGFALSLEVWPLRLLAWGMGPNFRLPFPADRAPEAGAGQFSDSLADRPRAGRYSNPKPHKWTPAVQNWQDLEGLGD